MHERLTVGSNGMVRYRYAVDRAGEVAFDFHTSNEVGQPFQPWFKEAIERAGLTVETRELKRAPWVADFVVGWTGGDAEIACAGGDFGDDASP